MWKKIAQFPAGWSSFLVLINIRDILFKQKTKMEDQLGKKGKEKKVA